MAPDTPAFTVIQETRTIPITVAELEEQNLFEVVTTSPWEKGEHRFQGVLLRDFLQSLDLEDSAAIVVRAIDDYTKTIPNEDWSDRPVLLATRQEGELLIRRTQGPVRIVYPVSDHPEFDNAVHASRWIWLIDEIQPVDNEAQ